MVTAEQLQRMGRLQAITDFCDLYAREPAIVDMLVERALVPASPAAAVPTAVPPSAVQNRRRAVRELHPIAADPRRF